MQNKSAGALIQRARERAGISQRALARRAGTSQSVVARIELGITSPTWHTMEALVGAAGFDLAPTLIPSAVTESHMLNDVRRILALTPEERLAELSNFSRMILSARRV